jgi:hypothetical protein
MKLLTKQEYCVYYLNDSATTEIIYGGAAGGGKSALGVLRLIEQAQKYPQTRWLMGRSKLKTLKETTLNTFFELSSKLKLTDQYKYNDQNSTINWTNGSQILLKDLFSYPADPNFDSLGSLEITGAFIDECNQISYKAWQIVQSRIRYKLNEYKLMPKMLGTCNPSKNWVYSEFYNPFIKKELSNHRRFIQALPTDNPFLPKTYLESLLKLDQASKERLYFGNWQYDNDPAKLIEFDKIQNCFTNDFAEGGEKYISADVARFGSDKMVIMVWDGFRVEEIFSMDKSSITDIAEKIRTLSRKYKIPLSNVIADEDGVGGGLVDILKCNGFVNNARPLEEDGNSVQYQNLKTQCYYKLASLIQTDQIYINCDDMDVKNTIIEELEQVKRDKIDHDGKLKILPKEKVKELIGRSPDYSDALMMRMYFEIGLKFTFTIK